AKHARLEHTGIRFIARAVVAGEQRQRTKLVPTAVLKGRVGQLPPSVRTVLSCATRPRATMACNFFISPIVGRRKSRQVLISSGVGLFSGGTQRTALVIRQSISSSPSSGCAPYSPRAKPNFRSVS